MPGGRNSGAVYNMYPCKVGSQVIRTRATSCLQYCLSTVFNIWEAFKKLKIRNKKELFNQQLKGVDNPINSKFVFFNLILILCKIVKGEIGQFIYFIFLKASFCCLEKFLFYVVCSTSTRNTRRIIPTPSLR